APEPGTVAKVRAPIGNRPVGRTGAGTAGGGIPSVSVAVAVVGPAVAGGEEAGGWAGGAPAVAEGPGDHARAAGDRLHAATAAARAGVAVEVDDHVADVSGVAGGAGDEAATLDQAAAHAGGDHQDEQVVGAAAGTHPVFAGGRAVTVAGQPYRYAGHQRGEPVDQGEVPPGRDVDRADRGGDRIDGPGRADTDPDQPPVADRPEYLLDE